MTQKQLIIEYIQEFGSILPAKMAGFIYKGVMFGSETSKRCRELRKIGELFSEQDGKFERFFLKKSTITTITADAFMEKYGKKEEPKTLF